MNGYSEMKQRHQKEFNALPLKFAFSDKQFIQIMNEWGLDPERDLNQICRTEGGGFIQKKDVGSLRHTLEQCDAELKKAIAEDETGDGFIYEMFLCELADHEYGYTGEYNDTLDALGYTLEDVQKDKRLLRGLKKAARRIRGQ